jgi:hypothetical protein
VRRKAAFLAAALVAIAVAGGLAALVVRRVAPEQVKAIVARSLAEALATPVAIESAELRLGLGVIVEARRVSAWSGPEGPALSIPMARIRLGLLGLLAGELRPLRILLVEPDLELVRGADGGIEAPWRWAIGAQAGDPPPASRRRLGRQSIQAARDWLLDVPLPAPRVAIVRGRLRVRDAKAPANGLELREVAAQLQRDAAHEQGELRFSARVARGEANEGTLEGSFRLARAGESAVRLELEDLPLGFLAPYQRALHPELRLSGRASGTLELRTAEHAEDRIDLDLSLVEPRLRLPHGGKTPASLQADAVSLRAAALLGASRLELWSGSLRSGELALDFEAGLELPAGEDSRLRLAVRTPALSRGSLDRLLGGLPEELARRARAGLAHFDAGRIEDVELRLATRAGNLAPDPGAHASQLLQDLELRGRVAGASLRLAEGGRVAGLAGEFVFDRGRLDLRGSGASLDGRPLPALDLSLQGIAHLFRSDAVRCQGTGAVPGLPGREVLDRWVVGRRKPGATRSWSRLAVHADWIAHPLLFCAVRGAEFVLTPEDGAWHLELERATWAGAPLRGRGSLRRHPEEILSIAFDVGPPWQDASAPGEGAPWAAGRFELEARSFGPWRARGVAGRFAARGSELALGEVALDLEPEERVTGELVLDLGSADAVPYQARFQLESASAANLLGSLGIEETFAQGTVSAAGAVDGVLRGVASPFAEARGQGILQARDGALHRRVPAILALAMASDALRALTEREEIPFVALDATLELADGKLRAPALTVEGPWLRALAAVEIDAVNEPHPTDSVVAVYFFRTLDDVIALFPILNRVLLGQDANLISAYFALRGPLGHPEARLIPVKTLAAGPASFVLEGFPAFVRGGLGVLRSVLGPARAPDVPDAVEVRADS